MNGVLQMEAYPNPEYLKDHVEGKLKCVIEEVEDVISFKLKSSGEEVVEDIIDPHEWLRRHESSSSSSDSKLPPQLRKLQLKWYPGENWPAWLKRHPTLETLHFSYSWGITAFPDDLMLPKLQVLILPGEDKFNGDGSNGVDCTMFSNLSHRVQKLAESKPKRVCLKSDGSTPGSVAPSAVGQALGAAAASAVDPAEASAVGTGRVCPSGTVEKGVGLGRDGIGKDILAEVRPFQDPLPCFHRLRLTLELVDSLLSLCEGLLERADVLTVNLVPVLGSGKQVASDTFPDQSGRPSARLLRRRGCSTDPRQPRRGRFVPVLHQHVDHWRCGPRPVAPRAFNGRDLLDLEDLFLLSLFRSPGSIMFVAQPGGMRRSQGQAGRDRRFGARIREPRRLGLFRTQADLCGGGGRTSRHREAPHGT
nr:uncharacterized protein LOC109147065 [Ipomoea batatas]